MTLKFLHGSLNDLGAPQNAMSGDEPGLHFPMLDSEKNKEIVFAILGTGHTYMAERSSVGCFFFFSQASIAFDELLQNTFPYWLAGGTTSFRKVHNGVIRGVRHG